MRSFFQIAQLVSGPSGRDASHPWFLLETIETSDGPRTRICAGRWKTADEARAELIMKQERRTNESQRT